jgi:hypothetical protein
VAPGPLTVALALALAAGAAGAVPSLSWESLDARGREGIVRVEGLEPDQLAAAARMGCDRFLRVVALPEGVAEAELPNLWGTCESEGAALVFRPRHSLAPSIRLIARLDGAALDRAAGTTGTPSREIVHHPLPPAATTATSVTGVSPTSDEVPENLLRLYITFSAPMSPRGIEQHVKLLGPDGREIVAAFVPIPGGLWDPDRRRLTLFLHPGRVKSGIAIGSALGPVLSAGQSVRLVVAAAALDAQGLPLAAEFSHSWRVGPPARDALDPAAWQVTPPRAGQPLLVTAPIPLDRALVLRAVTIRDEGGRPVPGSFELEAGDRALRFDPAAAWVGGGNYRVAFEPVLEDLAGNRIGTPFERAAGHDPTASEASLWFSPGDDQASPPPGE